MNDLEKMSDNILKSTSKVMIESLEKEIEWWNKYKGEEITEDEFKGYINGITSSIAIIKNISGLS